MSLDDEGKLVIVIEGVTIKNSWRNLTVEVVLDGETVFMEVAKANNDGYTRTSTRQFEKLPEQVILYESGSDQDALVYDVANGVFEG